MSSALRPVFVVGGLALAVALMAGVSEWRAAHAIEIIPWREKWEPARVEATQSHRPMFAYFTASWCPPCQRMKSTTWADNSVKAALEKYVPVKIDVDAHPDLAQKYDVNSMPTYVIVSDQGKILRRRTGLMLPEEMLRWLEN